MTQHCKRQSLRHCIRGEYRHLVPCCHLPSFFPRVGPVSGQKGQASIDPKFALEEHVVFEYLRYSRHFECGPQLYGALR